MMKILASATFFLGFWLQCNAQNSEISMKDLAIPSSPAFIIMDASPSMIQTPNTPKSFILGVVQAFQLSNGTFPQQYSAEFAPYWWIRPADKSISSITGVPVKRKAGTDSVSLKENPFAGVKFTTLSTGFFNKDMVQDSFNVPQKIFSAGFRSTVLKIHPKTHAGNIQRLVFQWHDLAQKEMDNNLELLTEIAKHPEKMEELKKAFIPAGTRKVVDSINFYLASKPLFSLDIAGAYAVYGVGDTAWKSGRAGAWATASGYIPIFQNKEKEGPHYLNVCLSLRFLNDWYSIRTPQKSSFVDAGGKIAYESSQISLGVESIYRYVNQEDEIQNRTVGIFSYKVAENFYLHAAFGKNFDIPNKLIAMFGLNWGFGSESIRL